MRGTTQKKSNGDVVRRNRQDANGKTNGPGSHIQASSDLTNTKIQHSDNESNAKDKAPMVARETISEGNSPRFNTTNLLDQILKVNNEKVIIESRSSNTVHLENSKQNVENEANL